MSLVAPRGAAKEQARKKTESEATRRNGTMMSQYTHQALLAATENTTTGITAVVVIGACIAAVVLFVGALISIARSRLTGGMKFAWLVFAFVLPFVGSLLWFLVGRRDSLSGPRAL